MPFSSLSTITGSSPMPKDPNIQNRLFKDTTPQYNWERGANDHFYQLSSTGLSGWTNSTSSGQNVLIVFYTSSQYYPNSVPGGIPRVLTLRNLSFISQSIYFNPGSYTLSYYSSGRKGTYISGHQLQVQIGSQILATNSYSNTSDYFLTGKYSHTFTIASSGTYTLSFTGLNQNNGSLLSDIFLTDIFIT